MVNNPISIRSFIGAKDFEVSRAFYTELGFKELEIDPTMSYFIIAEKLGFYLQKHYVKGWIQNSMLLLEVENIEMHHSEMLQKDLVTRYKNIKITKIKEEPWAKVFQMLDPAGVLWHFAEFSQPAT